MELIELVEHDDRLAIHFLVILRQAVLMLKLINQLVHVILLIFILRNVLKLTLLSGYEFGMDDPSECSLCLNDDLAGQLKGIVVIK